VGKATACPPILAMMRIDGGHGASAPLPTLQSFGNFWLRRHSEKVR
jgi:hypothetical protein